MINFTNCPQLKKGYGGANGNKISIVYKNEIYMVKFPTASRRNPNISYINSCISEYLGCHIFNLLGIKAQETILGEYIYKDKRRIVVACKDFTRENAVFQDFASIKNQIIESSSNGYGTDLEDVLNSINNQKIMNPKRLLEYFWDIFIADTLVGNWDRHNGNWGFLYNVKTDTSELAPIFDLGSSLFPQLDENLIKIILKSKTEIKLRVYQIPTSALNINNKRINYYDFISNHINKDCDEALKRIVPKINLQKINNLIDSVDLLSNNYKLVLKKLIKARKELILDKAYKDLI